MTSVSPIFLKNIMNYWWLVAGALFFLTRSLMQNFLLIAPSVRMFRLQNSHLTQQQFQNSNPFCAFLWFVIQLMLQHIPLMFITFTVFVHQLLTSFNVTELSITLQKRIESKIALSKCYLLSIWSDQTLIALSGTRWHARSESFKTS